MTSKRIAAEVALPWAKAVTELWPSHAEQAALLANSVLLSLFSERLHMLWKSNFGYCGLDVGIGILRKTYELTPPGLSTIFEIWNLAGDQVLLYGEAEVSPGAHEILDTGEAPERLTLEVSASARDSEAGEYAWGIVSQAVNKAVATLDDPAYNALTIVVTLDDYYEMINGKREAIGGRRVMFMQGPGDKEIYAWPTYGKTAHPRRFPPSINAAEPPHVMRFFATHAGEEGLAEFISFSKEARYAWNVTTLGASYHPDPNILFFIAVRGEAEAYERPLLSLWALEKLFSLRDIPPLGTMKLYGTLRQVFGVGGPTHAE